MKKKSEMNDQISFTLERNSIQCNDENDDPVTQQLISKASPFYVVALNEPFFCYFHFQYKPCGFKITFVYLLKNTFALGSK